MEKIFELIIESLHETIEVSGLIFLLMVLIEFIVLKYKDSIIHLAGKRKVLGYFVAALAGASPGCMGLFAMDSLYMAGLLTIGGLMTSMIVTLGDESFVLISMMLEGKFSSYWFIVLYVTLFAISIIGGVIADLSSSKLKFTFHRKCEIEKHEHDHTFSLKHFLTHHIFDHILKKHILKITLWVFFTVLFLEFFRTYLGDLDYSFLSGYVGLLLVALIGLLPISGPHILFIVLFAQGAIPFSFLLTNSIIQDGHGLLPILGFSPSDAIKIKVFKFIIGLGIGVGLFMFGL